jgi:uncharacterized membrane protein YeiH
MLSPIEIIDLIGTAAFGASGALLAARHRLGLTGFIFAANITGVGGGTVRDLLLDAPVFWMTEWKYLLICTVAAVITFYAAHSVNRISKALLWADALGMALFGVLGAQKALSFGVIMPVAIILGVFSACLGGAIRDIFFNELPMIFKPEIYVTASLVGVLVYCILTTFFQIPEAICMLAGGLVAFGLRALGITINLSLPEHKGLH